MNKRFLAVSAAILLGCALTSCGTPKTSSKIYSEVTGEAQKSDSPEEALKEIYAAVYTPNSGEICYKYMYPGLTIQALKEQNMYDTSIENFNKGQQGYVDLISQQPQILSIDKTVPFTEEQLREAAKFFAATSAQAGIITRSSNFNPVEGYEFTCTITDINGNQDTDTECMVYLENDGWKNIPSSIEGMLSVTSQYNEEAAIEAVTNEEEFNKTSDSNE